MDIKRLLTIILILISIWVFGINPVYADEEATVSATIVGPSPIPTPTSAPVKFIIYGYGPTQSSVYLTGIGASEETKTDSSGYFEFSNLTFPTLLSVNQGYFYPELCLYAIDDEGRLTSTTCIPPMPFNVSTQAVGPFLLSPTLALSKGSLYKGDISYATGRTIPNTVVEIHFTRENKKYILNIIPDVSAYSLPIYQIESDDDGYFEFSLPTNTEDNWKIFSSINFIGSQSPLSNVLSFSINPLLYKIVNYYKQVSFYIKPTLFNIILILEIFTIFFLIYFALYLNKKYERLYGVSGPTKNINELQSDYERIQEEYLELLRRKDFLK